MTRTKTLPVKVNERELATFEEMARREKLAVGTFVRRLLLLEAEKRGITSGENANRTALDSEAQCSAVAG